MIIRELEVQQYVDQTHNKNSYPLIINHAGVIMKVCLFNLKNFVATKGKLIHTINMLGAINIRRM